MADLPCRRAELVRFLMCIPACPYPYAYCSFQTSKLPTQQKLNVIGSEGNLDHERAAPVAFKLFPPLPATAVNAQFRSRQHHELSRDSFCLRTAQVA